MLNNQKRNCPIFTKSFEVKRTECFTQRTISRFTEFVKKITIIFPKTSLEI